VNVVHECLTLGNTGIKISPLGVGAWSWGDKLNWGYGQGYQSKDIQEAFEVSIEAGINFIDTAESYGNGQSERYVGELIHSTNRTTIVASKFMPYPWRLLKLSLLAAIRQSLKRLNLKQIDLYQIHHPFPPVPIEIWAEALADIIDRGLTKSVGVSNYSTSQMRRAISVLVKRDKMLASNQVEYNLLNRKAEFSGLMGLCKELKVTLIAYSPLAQGLLTGKYTPEKPPPGIRGYRYSRRLITKIQPLIQIMREIGRSHDSKTPSQVGLNWVMYKGAVPIPGSKNGKQAMENAGAMGWSLTSEEVGLLDQESNKIQ
jgi:aryl-alcohol dehydrogenase-like predicted oxidoreductase